MRKISIALIIVCLCLSSGLTAYAQTGVTITPSGPEAAADAVTIVDWTAVDAERNSEMPETYDTGTGGYAAVPVRDISASESLSPVFYPQNVETVTENGVVMVKKTFEVSPDVDPQVLVQPFEQYGYSFVSCEILRQQLPGETLTRPASKTAVYDSDNDDKAEILKQFPASIDYEENGYSGELHLDVSTLFTEAEDFETYTYSYTKSKEFTALDRNDPSYLSKELDGMQLTGVSFTGQREESVGNSLVPTQYTGVAQYTGTAVGKRPISYVTTATYHGEITKTAPGNILYTVIYEGIAIESPDESEKQPEQDVMEQDATEQDSVNQTESVEPVNSGITLFHVALTGLAGILLGGVLIPKFEPIMRKLLRKNREGDV